MIYDETALAVLFSENEERKSNLSAVEIEDLKENLTCVMQITKDEALSCFDVEDLTVRVEDRDLGIYYRRP